MCWSFRSISDKAAYAITGMMPIDFLADKMMRIYDIIDRILPRKKHRKEKIDKQVAITVGTGVKGTMYPQIGPQQSTHVEIYAVFHGTSRIP